jgi:Na+-translocating ferredoxin:NAD+ oxidoreductase subunit B
MIEEIYKKLAERLDAIPNGFPATQSGVELRLLEKIFTPEEAHLASVMRLTTEPASEIAARARIDPEIAYSLLKTMARQGQIRTAREEGKLKFGLLPFIVGFYEEQLPRMDREMAMLFEEYMQETKATSLRSGPSLHRVIPVKEAIPFNLEIFPYDRAAEMIENAKSWAVRDCICRVQQRLIGKGCDHPVENCLVFAPVEGAFNHSRVDRPITKEESLRLLREAEQNGLVHSTGNQRSQNNYICNCCTCCCGILRGVSEFDIPTAVAHSDYYSVVDNQLCSGCEDCVVACHFDALAMSDGVCVVNYSHCVGCGLCALACSTGALHLELRPVEDRILPPSDIEEWMLQRAIDRNLQIFDIL